MKVIKEITSRDNGIFKLIRSLKVRKNRTREALFVVEGPKQVTEALRGRYSIKYIAFRNDFPHNSPSDFSKRPELVLKDRLEGFDSHKIQDTEDIVMLNSRLFKELSDTETDQGVLAVIKREDLTVEDFVDLAGRSSNILALDRVQDPGNVGTLIRTAEGAGFKGIVTLKGTGDPYGPKAVRAAGGAILRLPHIMLENPEELKIMADIGGKKIATTSVCNGIPYYQADLSENLILVMGNEGNGVSGEVEGLSELSLNIPTEGELESLNVATAGAILMMDSLRQRRS
ncbi:MAG: RNA methyltransferase [Clostridiales bacterium]|nr:RNA methyltransferase [Clostridiales bacterium]MDY4060390.1 RNA methyltransferase [Anaerovoracaceae bacterium]